MKVAILLALLAYGEAFRSTMSRRTVSWPHHATVPAEEEATTGGSTASMSLPDMEAYANGYKTAFSEISCQTCSPTLGSIPEDLVGTYYRSGPAMFSAGSIVPPKKSIVQPKQPPVPDGTDPDRMVLHPMEGDGAILGVTFSDDHEAIVRFRYVRTIAFTAERKKGARLYTGMDSTRQAATVPLGNDLPLPLFRHHLQPGLNKLRKNVSNTRSVYWGKRLLSLWEGGQPYKMDALALSTEGRSRLGGAIAREPEPFGGKMVVDPVSNTALGYGVEMGPKSSEITLYEFNDKFRLLENGRSRSDVPGLSVISDFAATENYAVFIQPSVSVNAMKFLVDKAPANVLSASQESAVVHLIPRTGRKKNQLSIPIPADELSDANVQICNAYEDGDVLVVDAIRSDTGVSKPSPKWPWVGSLSDYQSSSSNRSLWRYEVNTRTKSVSKTLLSEDHALFGSVNPDVSTRKHRYIYSNVGRLGADTAPPQGIRKFDCETGIPTTWMPQPYEYCGEPMYARRRDAGDAEDSGYILSVLLNGKTEQSELVILQASNIGAGPITRIPLGMAIPHGLHGCFADDDEAGWSKETIERRAKLSDKMEAQGNMWNEVKSDFSGLGLRFDDMEEYFGDWNPFA